MAALAMGCRNRSTEPASETSDDRQAVSNVTFAVEIKESKILFATKLESFSVEYKRGTESQTTPCRDLFFWLSGKKSLYTAGWLVDSYLDFADDSQQNSRHRRYSFAGCRAASHEALAWFGNDIENPYMISEELLDDRIKLAKNPLLLRIRDLEQGKAQYFSCAKNFVKTLVGETDKFKTFKLSLACEPSEQPAAKARGTIDFLDNPGPLAHIAAYRPWQLPSVASNEANFKKALDALAKKVPEGKYNGIMTTNAKTCSLKVAYAGDKLQIEHVQTATTAKETRKYELTAADLLGYVEGKVYKDPIRVIGEPIGEFAGVEFVNRKKPGETIVFKFEKNSNAEGMIVRVNGGMSYCRRLK